MPPTTVGSGMLTFRPAVAAATLSRDVTSSMAQEEATVSRTCELPSGLPPPKKRFSPVTSSSASACDSIWALPFEVTFGMVEAGPPVAL